MSAAVLLERLDRVHQASPDRWRAVCPAHKSKSRTQSLAIREMPDGTVLMKCFAGCGAHEIAKAAGIHLRDLFPPNHHAPQSPRSTQSPNHWQASREAIKTLKTECQLVAIIAHDVAEGRTVPGYDAERCIEAVAKILSALRACE